MLGRRVEQSRGRLSSVVPPVLLNCPSPPTEEDWEGSLTAVLPTTAATSATTTTTATGVCRRTECKPKSTRSATFYIGSGFLLMLVLAAVLSAQYFFKKKEKKKEKCLLSTLSEKKREKTYSLLCRQNGRLK